jgi:hypothetical protein
MDEKLPTRTIQFHIAEYTFLHGEIRDLNGAAGTLERKLYLRRERLPGGILTYPKNITIARNTGK